MAAIRAGLRFTKYLDFQELLEVKGFKKETGSVFVKEVAKTVSYANKSIKDRDASILASTMVEQVDREDIASMVYIQRDMLSRFEKTNEMLINFNILSTGRYEATLKDFSKHTQLLYDMKRDLDSIFKRIRVLKQRLGKIYPEAFAACSSIYEVDSDDDDSESEEVAASAHVTKDSLQVPASDLLPPSSSQDSSET